MRDQWGAEQGFPGGPVYAIAQTPDGYLWIGTEKGLVRFDGWRFQPFPHADTPAPVLGLLADAEGNLWIRLRSPSLLRYRAGKFENVIAALAQTEPGITAMTSGNHGEALFAGLGNGTLRYRNGKFVTLASRSELPNFLVISLAETSDRLIWLGTRDVGLFRLHEGRIAPLAPKLPDRKINCLLPDGQNLWVGTDNGVVRWNGVTFDAPLSLKRTQALTMLRDRDANVWIGTVAEGLLRFNGDSTASLAGSRAVTALFEDREGNLWVGSAEGLERVRDSAFVSYDTEKSGPLYVNDDGHAWFAPTTGGLCWLDTEGHTRRVAALDDDVVYSITGGDGELWVGRQRSGLTRLRGTGAAVTYTQADGLAQNSVYAVHRARDGSVWAGTLNGGASRFSNGKFTTFTIADGLASNAVTALLESADGTIWFATPNGLSALS
ncbi:MAG TPA: two-component regulator propeller domain-containing protein, partial [Roseiflexaceae bacterium]|nr:two-component regulator propeller domain-containing protein [Roseiflexaceae bacterium]